MNTFEMGITFENECIDLLKILGFEKVEKTKASNDQGGDIIGILNNTKYIFQCKNHQKKQGNKTVQEALGAKSYYKANRCGIIAKTGFTKSAYSLAKPNYCILINHADLLNVVKLKKSFLDLITNYNFPKTINYIDNTDLDYQLLKNYEEIKSQLGHTPRIRDLDKTTSYHIKKKYKSFGNFLKKIGDKPYSIKPSDDDIKLEYMRIKELIFPKNITLADIEQYSKYSKNSFKEYPFRKLKLECGDRPNIERGVSKTKLIIEFRNLEMKLNRIPTLSDLDKFGMYKASYYRTRWGNMDNFYKEMNIPLSLVKQTHLFSKNNLAVIYLLISELFKQLKDNPEFNVNHTVLEKLMYQDKTLVSATTFSQKFNGWNNFKEHLKAEEIEIFRKQINTLITEFTKN